MCIFCEKAQNELAGGLTPAQQREAERCDRLRERRVRATILTGFLGAGKTTLLNFILKSLKHGQRIAVVQNEFGSVSVDDKLMPVERNDGAEVITMPNGCLCCRVRGDLVEALKRIAENGVGVDVENPLDGLIIECSGLSEVTPVCQTFFVEPSIQAVYQLDGVVCVCDAGNFEAMETGASAGPDVSRLLREQLGLSDVCLLNKCDLVSAAQRDALGARIRTINPAAKIVPCRQGKVNLGQVLKTDSFTLEAALSLDAHFLPAEPAPVPEEGFGPRHPKGLRRAHTRFAPPAAACQPSHAHELFGSLGIEVEQAVDLEAFKEWMRGVVLTRGEALVRCKGLLKVGAAGGPGCVVVQGVGGHIEVGDEYEAPGTATSRLVFIGALDDALRQELEEGFLSTLVGASAAAAV